MKTETLPALHPRMKNPTEIIPEATPAVLTLFGAAQKCGVAPATVALAHLRISQINGCAPCIDGGARHAKQAGETDERLFAVSAWRETPYFSPAERAALALAESVTRLSDRSDPVPDEVWNEATRHYNETEMAGLLLSIAAANVFNRLNVPTRQVAGAQKW